MAVIFPPDVFVPPDDRRALLGEMAGKPGDWTLFSSYPAASTYTFVADVGDALIQYKVQLDTEPLFDANREDETDSLGKRFGDGRVVARVPEHLLWANEGGNLGEAFAEGDRKHVKKILNDSDFRKFRSFRGAM